MLVLYIQGLLAATLSSRLEVQPFLPVCGDLFNIFAATFHIWKPPSSSATRGCAIRCSHERLSELAHTANHSMALQTATCRGVTVDGVSIGDSIY
jgi:hypothetical protein